MKKARPCLPAGRPIGVFDSGVGGLTVFKALRDRLPAESLVYFGDTAHLPYGAKSAEAVRHYSLQIGRFLVGRGIKLLVVACNTASAVALDALRSALPVPVVGVIEPGAKAAVRASRTGSIGVIGTEATVASRAYEAALRSLRPRVRILSSPCPVFVPIVEEGWWDDPIAEAVAKRYLAPLTKGRLDTLILGCTHYPLLKKVIGHAMGAKVELVDSAEETAREVESLLTADHLLSDAKPSYSFYASDAPDRFKKLAKRLLGLAVQRVQVQRFD
jgi:glutamate racemase